MDSILLAEQAMANPDSWDALAGFLEQATAQIAADRGLRQILMYAPYRGERFHKALARLQPTAIRLVERARNDGVVRDDLEPSDIPLIEFMLATAADYAWDVRRGVWRRYLTLVLDGLRPERAAPTPLPEAALSPSELRQARQTPTTPPGATGSSPAAPRKPAAAG